MYLESMQMNLQDAFGERSETKAFFGCFLREIVYNREYKYMLGWRKNGKNKRIQF